MFGRFNINQDFPQIGNMVDSVSSRLQTRDHQDDDNVLGEFGESLGLHYLLLTGMGIIPICK